MTALPHFLAQGKLVGIRQVTPDDYPLVYESWHDADVQRNLNFVDEDPLEVWQSKERNADHRCWLECIVFSLADGRPAGYVSLGWFGTNPELVILLLPAYRGQGLGTEASRLIIDYGFSTMGIDRVGGGAFDFNSASQSMLARLGFLRDPMDDASYENAWGGGEVTELAYHMDRDGWQRTRSWSHKARPAVFDARPALETIKQLDYERVCGSEGEARAMEIIAKSLTDLGIAWQLHTFQDWWEEPADPHLKLQGRKLPVRPVMEPSYLCSKNRHAIRVHASLAPTQDCAGCIAVAKSFDGRSAVARDAVAQLMAFERNLDMEPAMWASEGDLGHIPTAYLQAEDIPFVLGSLGKEAVLEWDLKREQREFTNLVAEIPGTTYPCECVVMGAHVDSFPGTTGASDDASGCAILLEAAKWFVRHPAKRTIRLVWFTGEELDGRGSRAYIRDCVSDPSSVKLMINVDSTCELDTDPFDMYASDEEVVTWARQQLQLGDMKHELTQAKGVDAGKFIARGIPALLFEAPFKPSAWDAHTPDDRPETIDPHKLQFLGSISIQAAIAAAEVD